MPPYQSAIDTKIARRIDPERRRDAEYGRERSSERRSDRAAEVEADAVRRDRGRQVLLGHELRRHRLPGGRRERPEGADQEREQEQDRRGHEVERDEHREDN